MKVSGSLLVGGAPFIHEGNSTAGASWLTIAALAPSLAWGCLVLGLRSLAVVGVAIFAAVVADLLQSASRRRVELGDGTAVLTGLMIGFSMPATVPVAIPAAASLFAILVVKGAFGGLGNNWMNPALAGVSFAWLNWPGAMTATGIPADSGPGGAAALALFRDRGFPDSGLTSYLNNYFFSPLGATLPDGYLGLVFGFRNGGIGELSGLLLLAASSILVARRIVRWQIPLSIFLSFAALEWTFGGLARGNALWSGDVLGSVFSGSFLLVALFMATDPVTSPSRRIQMCIYGAGIGFLTFALRIYGPRPEAMAFAVIMANCFVPLMERARLPRVRNGSH
jgi:electron transport complex protein RnfD